MSNAVKRALRTALQTFVGTLLASGVLGGSTVDLGALQSVLVASGLAAIVSLLSFVQNSLEDSGKVGKFLG